jgi:hypothetical protein
MSPSGDSENEGEVKRANNAARDQERELRQRRDTVNMERDMTEDITHV